MPRPPVVLALLAGLMPGLAAQQVVWQKVGKRNVEWIGGPPRFVGDVDKDGYEDLMTMTARRPPPKYDHTVYLDTVSGRDGKTLRSVTWPKDSRTWYVYRDFVRAGDVNGDGWPDYAAGRTDNDSRRSPDSVDLRSGRDDRVLWTVVNPGPWGGLGPLLGDVDLNGDRRPDLVVSFKDATGLATHAFDHTGKHLYRAPIFAATLGRIGDLDKDGGEDFVVGGCTLESAGGACVVSGRTGKELLRVKGERPGDYLGRGAVAGCGDVDADGILDFAASGYGGFATPGLVIVFSGKTGKQLYNWRTPVNTSYGSEMVAGDLDLDGVVDLLVFGLLRGPGPGGINWQSLRDGRHVTELRQPPIGWGDFDIGRPQPGSRFPVFAVSEPLYGNSTSPPRQGRIWLFRALAPGVVDYGKACAGTLAAAPRIGMREHLAAGMRVHLTGAPPGAPVALFAGRSRTRWGSLTLPFALDRFGFTGCSLWTSIDVLLGTVAGTTGNDKGYAFVDVPLLLKDTKRALTLHGQWLVLGQGRTSPGGLTSAFSWGH